MTDLNQKNKKSFTTVMLLVAVMIGVSFASVPLYKIFCQVTGFGGTTQVASKTTGEVLDRVITVRFNADSTGALNWDFKPSQLSVDVNIGAEKMAFYTSKNLDDKPNTGNATFNVTPLKAGKYFNKIDCFCFTEQTLEPGKLVQMPVLFFIDPEMANDRNLDDVNTITLSYSFFKTIEDDS